MTALIALVAFALVGAAVLAVCAALNSQADARLADWEQVTRLQLTKIAAQMGDLGITDRDEALAYVAQVIGRPVETRNELTRAEASRLIEFMALALGEVPDVTE
jgi:hypothetical protein